MSIDIINVHWIENFIYVYEWIKLAFFVVPDIDIIESEIDSLLYSNTRMRAIGYPIYKEIMNIMIYLSNGNIEPEGMILSIYVGKPQTMRHKRCIEED